LSIHSRLNEAYKNQVLDDFEQCGFYPNTAEGLLDFIREYDDYVIYHRKDPYDKTTVLQRLNTLWVVPTWFVISPFLWITTGKAGFSQHSKIGKWLAKITGL